MDHQIATALQKLHSSGGGDAAMASIGIEQKLQGLLKNMEEVYFVTLLGSYNIWQEVSEVGLYTYLYTIMVT